MTAEAETLEVQDPKLQIRDLVAASVLDDGKSLSLTKEGKAAITEAVDSVLDSPLLLTVVDAMLVIAHFIEDELKANDVAKWLTDLVNRPIVINSMKKVFAEASEQNNQEARKAATKLAELTQRKRAIILTAPTSDAESPKGTVKLDTLNFPKRL